MKKTNALTRQEKCEVLGYGEREASGVFTVSREMSVISQTGVQGVMLVMGRRGGGRGRAVMRVWLCACA